MRHFTAALLLLRDVEEVLGFGEAGSGVGEFAFRGSDRVIVLGHGSVEAASSEIGFGTGDGFGSSGGANFTTADEREKLFMRIELLVIDVNAIVRDKDTGGRAVAFRVDELIDSRNRGECCGFGLDAILTCDLGGDV